MTVSHDAYSAMGAEARGPSNPQAHTWTHTPSGTPKGILVWFTLAASVLNGSDNPFGAATYGGVAMTKVGESIGAGGEGGAVVLYELLSGIPTGAQTVSVTVTAYPTSSTGLYPYGLGQCVSMASAGGAIARADSDEILNGSLSNPSVTMDAGSETGISYLGGYSALGGIASITAASGCTTTGSYDFTNSDNTAVVIRQTTPATGTFAIGYTGAADDVVMVAATYYEVAASTSRANRRGLLGVF